MALSSHHHASFAGHQYTIPLSEITSSFELGLALIVGHPAEVADIPVQWVHTSELKDPTPFLTPRTVLLTTGSQFSPDLSATDAHAYVERLRAVGVSALGFAVDMFHDRIPHALVLACEHGELPLFRVPYDTPFIAITQHATRQLAAMGFERERWSLDTQRAISRAALRRLGLNAAIDELGTRLGRWVLLTNERGIRIHGSAGAPGEHDLPEWITETIEDVGRRGVLANLSRSHDGQQIHVQTIGGSAGVQGVLTVESSTQLDHAEHSAVELVAALAALHLEQHRRLSSGRSELKSAVLSLLLRGETATAAAVSHAFQHHLPERNLLVFYLGDASSVSHERFEQVQGFASGLTEVLVGVHDNELLLLTPPRHVGRITELCESLSLVAGVSGQHGLADISTALSESRRAYRFATATSSARHVHSFTTSMNEHVTSLLRDREDAIERAHQLLLPLTQHDARAGDSLVHTLTVWLEHHGQNSPAADALGVHRHTVANRIRLASELLGRDLHSAHDRADLLIALTLAGPAGTDPTP